MCTGGAGRNARLNTAEAQGEVPLQRYLVVSSARFAVYMCRIVYANVANCGLWCQRTCAKHCVAVYLTVRFVVSVHLTHSDISSHHLQSLLSAVRTPSSCISQLYLAAGCFGPIPLVPGFVCSKACVHIVFLIYVTGGISQKPMVHGRTLNSSF